jgi:hypothetical protein
MVLCLKNGSDPTWVVLGFSGQTTGRGSDPFFGQSWLMGLCPRDWRFVSVNRG